MKYNYLCSVLLLALLFISCTHTKNGPAPVLKEGEAVYWINSSRVDCSGVGPMKCLQVQKGDVLKPDAWTLFYGTITGFEYEPGYVYKLVVKEEAIPKEQVPADASSIRYTLVKQLEKQKQ
ncbi:DUF4377 domain-containing protein [Niabella beijingensis]|uniref:DUF4377 domain-containing protein n=1 Tax=Niabella beijingensis TaxID=2872700 RepID=UPI001CBACD6B|nr:DUF4377 domain-containing protein [Niabella beijingensis]MBZ4190293.1 DUF4377 domain-containing protein [Niabella beijingensis]